MIDLFDDPLGNQGRIRNKLRGDKRKEYLAEEWAQLHGLNIDWGDFPTLHLALLISE